MEHRLMRYFDYDHLPARLQYVSKLFYKLAHSLPTGLECTDEDQRTVALQHLLDAKDAAVRSVL